VELTLKDIMSQEDKKVYSSRSNYLYNFQRELGIFVPNTAIHQARVQYKVTIPNETVFEVDVPFSYIKKFSPSGKVSFHFY